MKCVVVWGGATIWSRTCSRGLLIARVWGLGSGALGGVGLKMSSVESTKMGDTENCIDVSCTNFSVRSKSLHREFREELYLPRFSFTYHGGENASATASIAFAIADSHPSKQS